MQLLRGILLSISVLMLSPSHGQSLLIPSDSLNKTRTVGVSAFNGLAWGGSITALHFVWYKDFDKTGFHFFDDSHEWMQMDKLGHTTVSWHMARASGDLYEWSGMDHKHASLLGAGYSFAYMATFEMLDAYNVQWGFSWSDLGFNALGSLSYGVQEFFWNRQFFKIKFSDHHSGLAEYRPDVLGSDPMSRMLKDYNGQTYWMSFNPVHWFKPDSKIPKWINLSVGYGIEDHLVGNGSTYVINDGATQQSFTPYRQLYLSFDIDFEEIPVQSKWLKMVLRGVNIVKIPFPTLEVSQGSVKFHPLYF